MPFLFVFKKEFMQCNEVFFVKNAKKLSFIYVLDLIVLLWESRKTVNEVCSKYILHYA